MAHGHIFKWLRNATHGRDANKDGSSTPLTYEWECTEDTAFINRMLVYIEDTGTFDAEKYGNGLTLSNGIKVQIIDAEGNVDLDFLDGFTITSNGEWKAMCHDYAHDAEGVGDENASVRWTWGKSGKLVEMKAGMKVRVTIQDNLAGLEKHWFQIQGYQE